MDKIVARVGAGAVNQRRGQVAGSRVAVDKGNLPVGVAQDVVLRL